MHKNVPTKFSKEVAMEHELVEVYITRLMKLANIPRAAIIDAIANDLKQQKVAYDETNIDHVSYTNGFLKRLAFSYVVKIAQANLGSTFKIEKINMSKFLLSDIHGTIAMSKTEIPLEIIDTLRVLS